MTGDFYEILMEQPEDEAKDIALSLELFVNSSSHYHACDDGGDPGQDYGERAEGEGNLALY